jgi:hypothetical protein
MNSNSPTPVSVDLARAAELLAANINPATGLATDYLNHFNEAIMLLEMVPSMPECADDFLDWQPMSYIEHFTVSTFKRRDLAVAAYETADTMTRTRFDEACARMHAILMAVRDGMQMSRQDSTRIRLAEQATRWLKPLVAQAGGIINGIERTDTQDSEPQSDIDFIMAH